MTEIEWISREIEKTEISIKRASEKGNAPEREIKSLSERLKIQKSILGVISGVKGEEK